MNNKYMLPIVSLIVLWLVGDFIFGNTGTIKNIQHNQHITALKKQLTQSQIDIQEMTSEYHHLESMNSPNRAFLVDQGRKDTDLVVFKLSEGDIKKAEINIKQESRFLFGVMMLALIIVIGCGCLFGISYFSQKNVFFKQKLTFQKDEVN